MSTIDYHYIYVTFSLTIMELNGVTWLKEHYPGFVAKRTSMIDFLPDLRLFQSPEAKASLKPWNEAMAWNRLGEDVDSCLHSPEEADRVLLDLLLKLVESKDTDLEDELITYHLDDLYDWCSSYPIISYIILNEEALYAFAVAADHPNLRQMLKKVQGRSSKSFIDEVYNHDAARRPFVLLQPQNRWNGLSLSLFAINQETSDWLVINSRLDDETLSIAEIWQNPFLIMSLWKIHGQSDRLFRIACRCGAIDVVLCAINERPYKDGDTNYLYVETAFHYLPDIASTLRLLEEIKDVSRLGYAVWDTIGNHMKMSSTGPWITELLPVLHSLFPYQQYGDDCLKSDDIIAALHDNNRRLIDFYIDSGIINDVDPDLDLLHYALHNNAATILPHLLIKYEYEPFSLLLDAANDINQVESDDSLRVVLKAHNYTKEQLTAALAYTMENLQKMRLLLKALDLVNETVPDLEYKRYEMKKK